MLAIEKLKKRDLVLAGNLDKLFECSDRQPRAVLPTPLRQQHAKPGEHWLMKDDVLGNPHRYSFTQLKRSGFVRVMTSTMVDLP